MRGSSRFVAGLVVGFALGTGVLVIRADQFPDDETVALAAEAQVDPLDLQGAVNTTGLDPRTYLCTVGELVCPPPQPPPAAPARVVVGRQAQADCIIAKESRGLDVPNAQGSGAWGPGQYFPGTWAWHTTLYRAATGYRGPLSLHSLGDVRRVMAYILGLPGMRGQWAVSGCGA
jgi:hypothetical protein